MSISYEGTGAIAHVAVDAFVKLAGVLDGVSLL